MHVVCGHGSLTHRHALCNLALSAQACGSKEGVYQVHAAEVSSIGSNNEGRLPCRILKLQIPLCLLTLSKYLVYDTLHTNQTLNMSALRGILRDWA